MRTFFFVCFSLGALLCKPLLACTIGVVWDKKGPVLFTASNAGEPTWLNTQGVGFVWCSVGSHDLTVPSVLWEARTATQAAVELRRLYWEDKLQVTGNFLIADRISTLYLEISPHALTTRVLSRFAGEYPIFVTSDGWGRGLRPDGTMYSESIEEELATFKVELLRLNLEALHLLNQFAIDVAAIKTHDKLVAWARAQAEKTALRKAERTPDAKVSWQAQALDIASVDYKAPAESKSLPPVQ